MNFKTLLLPLCLAGAIDSVQAQSTTTVNLQSTFFAPSAVSIQPGDTVLWNWVVGFHNVVSGPTIPDGLFSSGGPINLPGNQFQVQFTPAFLESNPRPDSTYPFYCVVHLALGMTGTVKVVQPLVGSTIEGSLGAGHGQTLTLNGPTVLAGTIYLMLGSLSGTTPTVIDGVPIPLTLDSYTLFLLSNPNALLSPAVGLFTPGTTVALTIPPASPPSLAGLTVNHAAAYVDPISLLVVGSTNPWPLTLNP